jgi:hypothetical protein
MDILHFIYNGMLHVARNWILHPNPRLVIVDGTSIRDQLVCDNPLSHELFVVAMRRFGQIDKANNKDAAGMCWRKFMDPDFAVSTPRPSKPFAFISFSTAELNGTTTFAYADYCVV